MDLRASSLPKVLLPLVALASFSLVIVILSRGEPVLVPLALAIVFAFILTPPVKFLERLGLPRAAAVGLTLLVVLGAVGGFGYVLVNQFEELSNQLTGYTASMRRKVTALRDHGNSSLDSMKRTVTKVTQDLDQKSDEEKGAAPVRLVPTEGSSIERLKETIAPLFEPLASALLVLVLVGFVLSKREDLRNRFIRLMGRNRMTLTTRAMDEAAHRVSQFLLSQSLVNAAFGTIVGFGLYWIGVPYAALWGFVAALFRFVPYVGSMMAMVIPTLLAFAKFPGWTQTLETVGLFVGLDGLTAYVLEPLFIGHRTGISSVALLLSTVFWTWLWGAKGLVLATPLTVCLAAIGKHVTTLRFLDVLLGDEPALEPDMAFYQRLLARDEDEAAELAEKFRAEHGVPALMEQLVLPALVRASENASRGEIGTEDGDFVAKAIREILSTLDLVRESDQPPEGVLCVAARSRLDEALCEVFALGPDLKQVARLPSSTLASEVVAKAGQLQVRIVCIANLPGGGSMQARHLCRRLRAALPRLKIAVLRPRLPAEGSDSGLEAKLREAGADIVAKTLAEIDAYVSHPLDVIPVEKSKSSVGLALAPVASN